MLWETRSDEIPGPALWAKGFTHYVLDCTLIKSGNASSGFLRAFPLYPIATDFCGVLVNLVGDASASASGVGPLLDTAQGGNAILMELTSIKG